MGTDVPLLTIALPPSNALTSIDISGNLHLDQGLGYAITGLGAASDTTAVAVGDVVGLNILYL